MALFGYIPKRETKERKKSWTKRDRKRERERERERKRKEEDGNVAMLPSRK